MGLEPNGNNHIRKLLEEGLYFLGLSREDEARRKWEEVLAREPENVRAKYYLSYLEKTGVFGDEGEVAAEGGLAMLEPAMVESGGGEETIGDEARETREGQGAGKSR